MSAETTRTARKRPEGGQPEATPEERPQERSVTLNLGFLRTQVRVYDLRLPRVQAPSRAQAAKAVAAVRSALPTPRQAVVFAGLGLAALVELIEWPVAVAIGLGSAVLNPGEHEQKENEQRRSETGPAPADGQPPRGPQKRSASAQK